MIDDRLSAILDFSHRLSKAKLKPTVCFFSQALTAVSPLWRWQIWSGFDYIIISEAYRTISRALLGMSTLSFNPKRVDCKRKKYTVRHRKREIIMLAQTMCAFCHDGRKSFYSLNKIYTSPCTVSLHTNPAKRVRFPTARLLSPQLRTWISNFQLLPLIRFHANKSWFPLFSCKCLYIGRDKCNQSSSWQGRRAGIIGA